MSSFLIAVIASAVAGVLVVELQGGLPHLARCLIHRAASRLPEPHDGRWRDEWLDHLDQLKLPPVASVIYALKIYSDAFEMSADLRPRRPRFARSQNSLRREMDIVTSVVLLILIAPVMIATVIAIKLDSPGPALIRQIRIGRNGQPFSLYRFRTMASAAEEVDPATTLFRALSIYERDAGDMDDARRTEFGRRLYRTSLNELPQLFSVLRGDMSLFGPLPGYPAPDQSYPDVRPGVADRDSAVAALKAFRDVVPAVWDAVRDATSHARPRR